MKRHWIKTALDILPLIAFFVLFKLYNLQVATIGLITLSISAIGVLYLIKEPISTLMIFSTILLTVLGGISIYFNDPVYIKIKPTIVYSIVSIICFYGYLKNKNFAAKLIKSIDNSVSPSRFLDKYLCLTFAISAIINEVVWRNFSDEVWVDFKVFFMPFILMLLIGISTALSLKKQQAAK